VRWYNDLSIDHSLSLLYHVSWSTIHASFLASLRLACDVDRGSREKPFATFSFLANPCNTIFCVSKVPSVLWVGGFEGILTWIFERLRLLLTLNTVPLRFLWRLAGQSVIRCVLWSRDMFGERVTKSLGDSGCNQKLKERLFVKYNHYVSMTQ
jgi:hypothetical protein